MKKRIVEILIAASLSCIFAACSSPTNGETGGTDCPDCGGFGKKSSSSNVPMSSSDGVEISSSSNALMISWIKTGKFWISQTEITQADYRTLMGTLPQQMTKSVGDSFPVANVSWYEAILFANALSKYLGLDTALHGGAWNSVAKELAFSASEKKLPDFASNTSGFRVVWIGE